MELEDNLKVDDCRDEISRASWLVVVPIPSLDQIRLFVWIREELLLKLANLRTVWVCDRVSTHLNQNESNKPNSMLGK